MVDGIGTELRWGWCGKGGRVKSVGVKVMACGDSDETCGGCATIGAISDCGKMWLAGGAKGARGTVG